MREISLKDGLKLVQETCSVLTSDGLAHDEYIEYVKGKGICYEDGCVIGTTWISAFRFLDSLEWTHNHKFYIQNEWLLHQENQNEDYFDCMVDYLSGNMEV